ncbi:MAG: efflux RND transporter periplasmic adaptor subunit [Gammaproteobacteria bacterium]|nr:efflux RND transporter periplasmic adaptor subunit [Gammaproteobacteria bacterium]MCB1797269.1 efflux RND transporter periplasmic adaptor subunit [Gammaproteobacteria bacterium]
MLKKLTLAIVGLVLVVGAIVYAKLGQFSAMGDAAASMAMPPETVTAVVANSAQWEQVISATATVSAVQGVTVSAEVSGRVSRIAFESGAMVAAGEVLLQQDTASEDAQLASAASAAALAQADLVRVRKLGKRDLASEDAVDRAEAQVKDTVAQVGMTRALIAKKTVRAPFAGRLGLRLVNLGQILGEGDPIVALQTLDPVHVDFSVPQRQLAQLHQGMQVRVTADAAPGQTFSGEIIAVSPEVDPATRNVRVRALVGNPGETLRTGMFANLDVVLPDRRSVLPVPVTAVLYAPFGDSVFVVEEQRNEQSGATERVLRQQFVRLGQARGDFVDITDGLKAGETVVTSGVFKLRSGAAVVIDNTLAPEPRLDPRPSDS